MLLGSICFLTSYFVAVVQPGQFVYVFWSSKLCFPSNKQKKVVVINFPSLDKQYKNCILIAVLNESPPEIFSPLKSAQFCVSSFEEM